MPGASPVALKCANRETSLLRRERHQRDGQRRDQGIKPFPRLRSRSRSHDDGSF